MVSPSLSFGQAASVLASCLARPGGSKMAAAASGSHPHNPKLGRERATLPLRGSPESWARHSVDDLGKWQVELDELDNP